MTYDTSKLIGPIVGAAGAAIGIGILAGTAKNISNMNQPRKRKRKPVTYQRKQQRSMKFKVDNYWGI